MYIELHNLENHLNATCYRADLKALGIFHDNQNYKASTSFRCLTSALQQNPPSMSERLLSKKGYCVSWSNIQVRIAAGRRTRVLRVVGGCPSIKTKVCHLSRSSSSFSSWLKLDSRNRRYAGQQTAQSFVDRKQRITCFFACTRLVL